MSEQSIRSMQLASSFRHFFKIPVHAFASFVDVDVYSDDKGNILVVMKDPHEQPSDRFPHGSGMSVTNAVGEIAAELTAKFGGKKNLQHITWVEHYPQRGPIAPTWALVTFGNTDQTDRFEQPQWKHLSENDFEVLVS